MVGRRRPVAAGSVIGAAYPGGLRSNGKRDEFLIDQRRHDRSSRPGASWPTGESRLTGPRIHESVVTPNDLNRRTVGYIEQLNRANMLG